jgi:hypothetical protein
MQNQPAPDADQPILEIEKPADSAPAGTPHYGTFGDPANVPATPEHHPNRPYVGGYMDPKGTHGGCITGPYDPSQQRGHADQNQAPEAVLAAQGQDEDVERAAYALDDPRYAGGDVYDPKNEQTSL